MHIVIIDDEKILSNGIKKKLESNDFNVTVINSYSDYKKARFGKATLYIIDISLGDGSGLDIIKDIKSKPENDDSSILIMSGHNEIQYKIDSFELGADDYIVKPFDPEELVMRVRKRIQDKHSGMQYHSIITYKNICFNRKQRTITLNDTEVHLGRKEKQIFEYFLLNQGKLVTKKNLSEYFWESTNPYAIIDNTINVTLCNLRKKFQGSFDLQTVAGEGYILKNDSILSEK